MLGPDWDWLLISHEGGLDIVLLTEIEIYGLGFHMDKFPTLGGVINLILAAVCLVPRWVSLRLG